MVLEGIVLDVERGKVKFLGFAPFIIFMHIAVSLSIANIHSLENGYKRQHKMKKIHTV